MATSIKVGNVRLVHLSDPDRELVLESITRADEESEPGKLRPSLICLLSAISTLCPCPLVRRATLFFPVARCTSYKCWEAGELVRSPSWGRRLTGIVASENSHAFYA